MNYALHYGLKPADRIVECITVLGISKHHAIYLGYDQAGTEWIAENFKFKGVRIVKAADYFSKVLRIKRIEKFKGTPQQREAAVKRALDMVGQPYSLINFNCEHFSEFVQHGKARSRQVENFGIGILAALFIMAIISES